MVKVTFTLDDDTVATVRRAAARLAKPQSAVVREAIRECASRIGKLTEDERRRLIAVMDTMLPQVPRGSVAETAAELKAIRASRRRGDRRHPAASSTWTRRCSSTRSAGSSGRPAHCERPSGEASASC